MTVRSTKWLLAALRASTLLAGVAVSAQAQSFDDHIFMDRRILCAGLLYTNDQWKEYWEGTLKRDNGNIGTLTTQSVMAMGAYGVTNRINLLVGLPYVATKASQGVLQGQSGRQDLMVGVKVNALTTPLTSKGTLHVVGVLSGAIPTSDYTADFLPMSIGSQSRRVTARALLSWQAKSGLYVNASGGYTHRANVTLDRPSYYTDGQLYMSNEVRMPDVRDAMFTVGFQNKRVVIPVTFTTQRTLGGGDIRRQDMPFVSNRMNFSRIDAKVQYTLPKLPGVALHVGGGHVLDGRNVGQSTNVLVGLLIAGKL